MYSATSTPKNEFGCGAVETWAQGKTGDNTVYVAVNDQGIWLNHPDLKNNIGTNPFEIPGNLIDDDGNGYIDDVYGWDFYSNDNLINDEGNHDYFHGTHCAGIIAAELDNYVGVAGVAPNVKLLSIKTFNGVYSETSIILEGIYYTIDLKKKGVNIVAMNCSWGSTTKNRSLETAIKEAENEGIIFACSAGNSGRRDVRYPSGYRVKNIISVASISPNGGLSYFSTWHKSVVDLAAPGEEIVSTYYGLTFDIYQKRYVPVWYGMLSGTSMAAPHVAGAVALYASLHPGAGYLEIKNAILSSTIPTESLKGKCVTGGRLDVTNF
jgi:subtilisin family serine protease